MNANRRARIAAIIGQLEALESQITSIREEEEEARDNIPKALAQGERAMAAAEAVDSLESAETSIQELMDFLDAAASAGK